MSFFRANYHDYELRLDENGRMRIVDWKDYYWGHEFTDRVGLTMVQAQPNKNAARKLVDIPNVRENQIFQIMEFLKATRDRDFDRYSTIVENMDARLQAQRIVIKLGLDTARAARKRRVQRAALEMAAEHFPNDAFFALPLMDYYLPEKRYQEAFDTLAALQRHLRIDDPLLNARMSSVLLAMERVDDAHELAVKSVTQEPGLELGWWSVFRARVTAEDYGTAIEALVKLEADFGHSLGPDALAKDPMFRPLMLSDEYRIWFEESD
jgi:tetratricopeptide (TPR) repeat protein